MSRPNHGPRHISELLPLVILYHWNLQPAGPAELVAVRRFRGAVASRNPRGSPGSWRPSPLARGPASVRGQRLELAAANDSMPHRYLLRSKRPPRALLWASKSTERACWHSKGHARGARKSGRVQLAFPEIHHSPPFGSGAIDPAGTGGASSIFVTSITST